MIEIAELIEQRLNNLNREVKERTEQEILAKQLRNAACYIRRREGKAKVIREAPSRQAEFYADPVVIAFVEDTEAPDVDDNPDEYGELDVMGIVPLEGHTRMSHKKKSKEDAELQKITSSLQMTTSFRRTESFTGQHRRGERIAASNKMRPEEAQQKKNKRDRRGEPLAGSSNGAVQVEDYSFFALFIMNN